MTKTLLVLRHGKAERAAPEGGDHARRLKRRGRLAASFMGRYLADVGPRPDLVVCSTAQRVLETAERFLEAAELRPRIVRERALYLTSPEVVTTHLARVGGEAEVCLFVNHEPTCSGLIGYLTGEEPRGFPTAALARIELAAVHWGDLRRGIGTLEWIARPRELMTDADERG